MLKDFQIVIQEDEKLNRLSISIDTELNFDDNFKYFLYLFELCTNSDKKADKNHTINLNILKNNSIKQLGRKFQVIFYDKNDENDVRQLYSTRMEFRLLGISSNDFKKHIDEFINLIDKIDKKAELINKNMSERIIRLYDYEINQKSVNSLSEFVRKYDRYIYTTDILKTLYEHMNLRGCYAGWLINYRRKNKIDLFTITDVIRYKDNCIKSIKNVI